MAAKASTIGRSKVVGPILPIRSITMRRTPASIADWTARARPLPKMAVSGGKKTFRRRSPIAISHPIEPLIIPANNSQTTRPVNKKTAKFWDPFPAAGGAARKNTENTKLYTRMVDNGLSSDHVHPRRLRLYLALSSLLAKFRTKGRYLLADVTVVVSFIELLSSLAATTFRYRGTTGLLPPTQLEDQSGEPNRGHVSSLSRQNNESRGLGGRRL